MGANYNGGTGVWELRAWFRPHSAARFEWRQDWFINLCLGAALAALLFLMILSIYLVLTKPAPPTVPEGKEPIAVGTFYADLLPIGVDVLCGDGNADGEGWT